MLVLVMMMVVMPGSRTHRTR